MSDVTDEDDEILRQYDYVSEGTGFEWSGWNGHFEGGPFDNAQFNFQAPALTGMIGARATVGVFDIGTNLDPDQPKATWHRYEFTQRTSRLEERDYFGLVRTFLTYRGQVPTKDYLEPETSDVSDGDPDASAKAAPLE